jgi:hypothetical protein
LIAQRDFVFTESLTNAVQTGNLLLVLSFNRHKADIPDVELTVIDNFDLAVAQ